uniref:arylamine N-acetyltransferase family protein n=1 Tax=Paractinoplanes polyasparticus TaxID=2856853 RepID=UPI0021027CA6|nr:arylamine N-acetyltransferase [Actinoplanes polyasparticus]
MDKATVDAYLARIGASRPLRSDRSALTYLHSMHLRAVPFENLAYHLGEPVTGGDQSVEKIVFGGRGGNCMELNSAFLLLLRGLGFDGSLLLGRVCRNGNFTPGISHVAARVRLDGDEHRYVDVGHFDASLRPLRIDHQAVQNDSHGRYSVTPATRDSFDVSRNGVTFVRMDRREIDLNEAVVHEEAYRREPTSLLMKRLLCSRATDRGRVTLSGKLLIHEEGGQTMRKRLKNADEIDEALRHWFGISAPTILTLR